MSKKTKKFKLTKQERFNKLYRKNDARIDRICEYIQDWLSENKGKFMMFKDHGGIVNKQPCIIEDLYYKASSSPNFPALNQRRYLLSIRTPYTSVVYEIAYNKKKLERLEISGNVDFSKVLF